MTRRVWLVVAMLPMGLACKDNTASAPKSQDDAALARLPSDASIWMSLDRRGIDERIANAEPTFLPRPDGSARVGHGLGGSKTRSIRETLSVPLPYDECVKYYEAEFERLPAAEKTTVQSEKSTVFVSVESKRVGYAVILASNRAASSVTLVEHSGTFEAREHRAVKPSAALSARPNRMDQIRREALDSVPLTLGLGSSTISFGSSGSRFHLRVLSSGSPNRIADLYQEKLEKAGFVLARAAAAGDPIVLAGHRGVNVMVVVNFSGPDAKSTETRFSYWGSAPDRAKLRRRRAPMIQIQPGFSVGEKLPEGFPLTLPGGSNVERARLSRLSDGRVRYRVKTSMAYVIKTSFGDQKVDQAQWYTEQLEKLGFSVSRAGNKLSGKGDKGECTVVIPLKGSVAIDCTMN